MNEAFLLLIASQIFFGALAIFFSFKEERVRRDIEKQKRELSHKIYEVSILNHLHEEIGYSLSLKRVLESIASSIGDIFNFSTFSYAVLDEDKIILKTYIREPVGKVFLSETKDSVLNCLFKDNNGVNSLNIFESITGPVLNDSSLRPLSNLVVQIVIKDKIVGAINISSKYNNIYTQDDLDIVKKIINHLQTSIEGFESIMETEKAKLSSMLMSAPSGAIMLLLEDETLKVTFVNNAAKEFLNIKNNPNTIDIISTLGTSFDLIKEVKSVMKDKKQTILNDVKIYDKVFKMYFNPVFLSNSDKIIGVAISLQDITLDSQAQTLKDNFTNVVHELRAPLTSIKGASELLEKQELPFEDRKKMVVIIKDSSRNMLGNVSNILDASKIEAGKFAIVKELSDINSLVKERAESFIYLARDKGINIEIDVHENIPRFEFDNVRIGEVVNNLISNSIKYSASGGKIEVKVRKNNDSIMVSVKDNGIGIPEEKQERLFARFGQLSDLFKKESSGLGLYISKGIVESHGGKIWVESVEGRGTTFCFTIPIINEEKKQEISTLETTFAAQPRIIN